MNKKQWKRKYLFQFPSISVIVCVNKKSQENLSDRILRLSICANNGLKSVLARDLGDCRDNLKNSDYSKEKRKGACRFEQQYIRGKEKDRERNKEADLHSGIYPA